MAWRSDHALPWWFLEFYMSMNVFSFWAISFPDGKLHEPFSLRSLFRWIFPSLSNFIPSVAVYWLCYSVSVLDCLCAFSLPNPRAWTIHQVQITICQFLWKFNTRAHLLNNYLSTNTNKVVANYSYSMLTLNDLCRRNVIGSSSAITFPLITN